MEPFTSPTAWRLTRCLRCGCEAHYRFAYTIDKNAEGEATCRACFWRAWAASQRGLLAGYESGQSETVESVRVLAESHGYEYLGPLTDPVCNHDPHRVRCQTCGHISAERAGDIAWGCSCQVNPRRMAKPAAKPLRDSDRPAVRWWDHERNPAELGATATDRTMRTAWWRCPECGHSFEARVRDMFGVPDCPVCAERRRVDWDARNEHDLVTPVTTYPELVALWADNADPATVMLGDYQMRRFQCTNGHYASVAPSRYLRSGCPTCRGQDTRAANAETRTEAFADERHVDGITISPEIAEQWHPTRNGHLRPADLSPGSRRVVWWQERSCGHEWQASPRDRERRYRLRCPECRTILDSLGYYYPDIAAQWSPDNPLTPWHVRPTSALAFIPEWICGSDPSHKWRVAASVRVNGSDCPMCRDSGKSRIELLYFGAIRDALGTAYSGLAMRHPEFIRRTVWVPDVTVNLPDGRTLLVEYDGSYWHAEKSDVDLDKSRDLLATGALVVRLRETPLPSLGLVHQKYLELSVYPTMPEPDRVVHAIREWLAGHAPAVPAQLPHTTDIAPLQ